MVRRLVAVPVLATVVAVFAVSVRAQSAPASGQSGPPAQQAGQGPGGMPPLPKPTNLKVLPKDSSPEDVIKVMRGFTGQLGVKCNFCHVGDPAKRQMNFASDEKPEKNVARTMMQMTNDINQKYLSQVHDPDAKPEQKVVMCGTCHRGRSMPAVFTPPAEPQGGPKR